MLTPQEQSRIRRLKIRAKKRPGADPQIQRKIKGIRRSKNGIPAVNPDPRPPGEPVEKKQYKPADVTPPNTPTPTPSNYTPPANATGLSSYVPLPGQPDPRDDRYWRDVVALMESRNLQQRELDVEGINSGTAYQEALSELARQEPREQQALLEGANRAGAIYSSRTTEDMGKLQQEFFMERAGLQRQKSEQDAYRSLAREALESGFRSDEVAALLEAIDRASQNELNRPAPVPPKSQPNTVGQNVRGPYGRNEIERYRRAIRKADSPEQRRKLRRKLRKAINAQKQG